MAHLSPQEEGRILAFIGQILFSAGLIVFSGLARAFRSFVHTLAYRRSEGWPTVPGRITTGEVSAVHGRFGDYALGIVGYAYEVEGAYYSGYLVRQFWDEQNAWTFVDRQREKSVLVRYEARKPQISVLNVAEGQGTLKFDHRPLRPLAPFAPTTAVLWSLRNVSDWAERALQKAAKDWPSIAANVDYAEPRILDDDAHWGGELQYSYSVDGSSYLSTHYFRARGYEDAREQVEPWRNRRIVIHYFPGNPSRSVLIPSEQDQTVTVNIPN